MTARYELQLEELEFLQADTEHVPEIMKVYNASVPAANALPRREGQNPADPNCDANLESLPYRFTQAIDEGEIGVSGIFMIVKKRESEADPLQILAVANLDGDKPYPEIWQAEREGDHPHDGVDTKKMVYGSKIIVREDLIGKGFGEVVFWFSGLHALKQGKGVCGDALPHMRPNAERYDLEDASASGFFSRYREGDGYVPVDRWTMTADELSQVMHITANDLSSSATERFARMQELNAAEQAGRA